MGGAITMDKIGRLTSVKLFVPVIIFCLAGCARYKTVSITTDPNMAVVYVNGEESGITPLTKKLRFDDKLQEYKVVAKKGPSYRDGEAMIRLEPKEETEYHLVLEKIEKTVRISTNPDMTTIYIDGVESGIAPLTKTLRFVNKSKRYEIIAKKEGYKEERLIIGFEPEDKKQYDLDLEKIETVSIELVSFEPKVTEKGVKLAIIRQPTLAYLEVIERSPNVKSVTRVTNNEDQSFQIGSPILSPTEDVLVYRVIVEEEEGTSYSNIWKTTIGSFGKTRVTYGKWRDMFPSFTPDGQYLVFSSNRTSANPTLWRIKSDGGGGITNITSTSAEDYRPSVSPDSNTVAYTSNPPGAEEPQIWKINFNGCLPTQLREGEAPQISSDGNKILFVRTDKISGKKQIWHMSIEGISETQLTQNIDYEAIDPKWSPDGKWIVYASDEGFDSKKRKNFDIWLMTADGSKKTQLTTNGSRDDGPCWDHTGKFIYFRSNRGGNWNIWRFEPIMP
jgi:tricorn protease-like protein